MLAWGLSSPLQAQEFNDLFVVTPSEKSVALTLVEAGFKQLQFNSNSPTYLTSLDLVQDKAVEEQGSKDRYALVSHYRYEGDATVLSYINLTQQKLIWQKIKFHLPTQLSSEEFQQMKALVMASPEVQVILGTYLDKVEMEAMLIHSNRPKDALFGHRVVRSLFRLGQDYLDEPFVQVDLTTRQVSILTPQQLNTNHHHHP